MLFGETVAVYCENHTEHADTVRSSQETHDVATTEPNRLRLFGKTVAVHCENHTEHTDTVRTLQETHYVSATETNRLTLFGETVAVYCENHTKHTDKVHTLQETHYFSEIKHKYFASIATKYSFRIITFTTCFGQRGPSSCEHHTRH
jgi:thioredoxin-related protein